MGGTDVDGLCIRPCGWQPGRTSVHNRSRCSARLKHDLKLWEPVSCWLSWCKRAFLQTPSKVAGNIWSVSSFEKLHNKPVEVKRTSLHPPASDCYQFRTNLLKDILTSLAVCLHLWQTVSFTALRGFELISYLLSWFHPFSPAHTNTPWSGGVCYIWLPLYWVGYEL